jgi:hypothetical protein
VAMVLDNFYAAVPCKADVSLGRTKSRSIKHISRCLWWKVKIYIWITEVERKEWRVSSLLVERRYCVLETRGFGISQALSIWLTLSDAEARMTAAAQRSLTYYCQCRIRVVSRSQYPKRSLAIEVVKVVVDYCSL